MALVFFFCFLAMWSFAQCNCIVLIPLSNQYKVTLGDTINNYARIKVSENINIRIAFDTVYQNIEIPVRITNNSDTPLIITRAYWGEPYIAPNFTKEPILKGDTTSGYYMLHCNNSYPSRFTKVAQVQTNQCSFSFTFKGVRMCRKKED